MKKVAILIDGEWFRRVLQYALSGTLITADVLYRNARAVVESDEEIFRVFYYDCPPYTGTETNPIDQSVVDFKQLPQFQYRSRFLSELKAKDYVAMRLGLAKKRGWTLTDSYVQQTLAGAHRTPQAADVFLNLEQKGVDMRIGIDVATLTLKKLVDRIILLSGDTDMIPAMKLARREGVQVVLVEINNVGINKYLDEDADLVRRLVPV